MTTDLQKEREAFEAAVFDAIDAGIKIAFDEAASGGEIFSMQVYDSICETLRADGVIARAALAAPAAPQPTGKQDLQVAAPQRAPSFNARHVSLSQPGAKIILTLELDAIEGAPQYIVTPVNPAVVRQAAPMKSDDHYKPPFDNCSFRLCDLPGQCRSEGKCHHPATVAAPQEQPNMRECRHCGFLCAPNPNESGEWKPLATPQEQPSDEEIETIGYECGLRKSVEHWGVRYHFELGSNLFEFARALLSRYGAAPQGGEDAREAKEAAQRARLKERFKNRPESPATEDFDLPAPNDPPQPAGRDAREVPKDHPLYVFALEASIGAYKPEELQSAARTALTTQGDSHD